MSMMDQVEKLEAMLTSGRVPGTSRTLVNVDRVSEVVVALKGELPGQVNDAEAVLRQKEGIIKQAELEARRLRAYADEEATTIRRLAEEQSNEQLENARRQAREMVEETSIVKASHQRAEEIEAEGRRKGERSIIEAQAKVNQIIANAEKEAEERRKGADAYAREVLFALEERIAEQLGQVRSGIDLLDSRNFAAAD